MSECVVSAISKNAGKDHEAGQHQHRTRQHSISEATVVETFCFLYRLIINIAAYSLKAVKLAKPAENKALIRCSYTVRLSASCRKAAGGVSSPDAIIKESMS